MRRQIRFGIVRSSTACAIHFIFNNIISYAFTAPLLRLANITQCLAITTVAMVKRKVMNSLSMKQFDKQSKAASKKSKIFKSMDASTGLACSFTGAEPEHMAVAECFEAECCHTTFISRASEAARRERERKREIIAVPLTAHSWEMRRRLERSRLPLTH